MAIYIDPIFKKGDRSKPENYRAVSRTSVTCEVLEHIVLSSNMNHLESHNILSDAQHDFWKKRSCVSQLVLAVLDLVKGIDARDQLDMTLLGFSKAFDKVPHGRLAVTQAPILWNLGTHTCLVFWLPELQDPAGVTGRTHLQHQPSNIWHPARQRYRPDAVSPLPQWSATVPLPKPRQSDSLLTMACYTATSRHRKMPNVSKRILTHCNAGSVIGWWNSSHINVRFYMSPINANPSSNPRTDPRWQKYSKVSRCWVAGKPQLETPHINIISKYPQLQPCLSSKKYPTMS